MSAQIGQAYAADDWVDDDHVNGFYKKGIIRTPDDYETMPQDMQPGDMEGGNIRDPGATGSMNQSLGSPMYPGDFPSQRPPANTPPQYALPPQNKSFMSKAKSLGKSIVTFPNRALMGDDGFFDDPAFWQGAGAIAGMGANSYLNYQALKNNPYYGRYGNPYGGFNPYGYGGIGQPYAGIGLPYSGIGVPYSPFSPYSSVNPYGFGGGFGNPYFGSGIVSNPLIPFGMPGKLQYSNLSPSGGPQTNIVPFSPYGGFGNYGLNNYGGFGNYGNFGGFGNYGNFGGFGNPGFGGGLFGRPGMYGGFRGFGGSNSAK